MELYLVRHGQSKSNARWEQNPSSAFHYPDPGLTDLGLDQAKAVGQYLNKDAPEIKTSPYDPANRRGFGITKIYSSLMMRAVQTAEQIGKTLELPVHGRTDLHEWGGLYEWEIESETRTGVPGPKRDFFEHNYPDVVLPDDFKENGWWDRPYEPHAEVPARARKFLEDILEIHGNTEDRIAVVTHGGFINMFLGTVVNMSEEKILKNLKANLWFVMNNTAVSRLVYAEEFSGIVYLNRLDHLEDHMITG